MAPSPFIAYNGIISDDFFNASKYLFSPNKL